MYQIGIVSRDKKLITPLSDALNGQTVYNVQILPDSKLNSTRGESIHPNLLIIDNECINPGMKSVLENLGRGSVEIAIIILKSGENPLAVDSDSFDDMLTRPVNQNQMHKTIHQLLQKIDTLYQVWLMKEKLRTRMHHSQIVVKSKPMRDIMTLLPRIAESEASVLITGETGTGKELIARAIHYLGPRSGQPFVPLDCATMPEHLVENELFGHARGAYTDAGTASGGLLKEANGGTLFLDEVEALPFPVQSKFLRFLQEHKYRPLGQSKYIPMDVRVIAATNIDLNKAVEEKTFRGDLYFRLSVIPLFIPPLRERKGEIPILIHYFLEKYGQNIQSVSFISEEKLQGWLDYHWPGNVRELENKVQEWLTVGTIELLQTVTAIPPLFSRTIRTLRQFRAEVLAKEERAYLCDLLSHTKGNICTAARLAGIDRKNLRILINKHGLDAQRFRV